MERRRDDGGRAAVLEQLDDLLGGRKRKRMRRAGFERCLVWLWVGGTRLAWALYLDDTGLGHVHFGWTWYVAERRKNTNEARRVLDSSPSLAWT